MATFNPKFLNKNLITDSSQLILSSADNSANKDKLFDRNIETQSSTSGETSGTRTIKWTTGSNNTIDRFYIQNCNWKDFEIKHNYDSIDIYTDLLLDFDGDLVDVSETPLTVTANGNATTSAAQKKFGTESLLLDGTGDYITVPADARFAYGTGDFTYDCWFYLATDPSVSGDQAIVGTRVRPGEVEITLTQVSGSNFTEVDVMLGNNLETFTGATITDSTWYHIEISRSSGTLRCFIDGTSLGTADAAAYDIDQSQIVVGVNGGLGNDFDGYIDEFRISNVARHTSNFTPEVAAYAANTSGWSFSPSLAVSSDTDTDYYFEITSSSLQNVIVAITDTNTATQEVKTGQLYIGTERFEMTAAQAGKIDITPNTTQRLFKLSDGTNQKVFIRKTIGYDLNLRNVSSTEKANYKSLYDLNQRETFVFIPRPATPTDSFDGLATHVNWVNSFDMENYEGDIDANGFLGRVRLLQSGRFG